MAKQKQLPEDTSNFDALAEIVGKEAAGFNPVAVTIKTLHMEAKFQIPGLGEATKRLEGLILASRKVRVFFPHMGNKEDTKAILDLTNQRPFCSSSDYFQGEVVSGIEWDSAPDIAKVLKDKIAEGALECAECPFDAWESVGILGKSGRGKACAELRRLLYFESGFKIPVILSVPTSSIRNWDAYCSALMAAKQTHARVMTEISLEQKEASGMKWSVLSFEKARDAEDALALELLEMVSFLGREEPLAKALIDLFVGRKVSLDDYPTNGSSSEEDF